MKSMLTEKEVSDWSHTTWYPYDARIASGKLLKLMMNNQGEAKVKHGEDQLYLGKNIQKAVSVWNAV